MIFDMAQFRSDNPNFDLECTEWTFDIPLEERIVEYCIDFDEEKLNSIKKRIKECRQWIENNLLLNELKTQVA